MPILASIDQVSKYFLHLLATLCLLEIVTVRQALITKTRQTCVDMKGRKEESPNQQFGFGLRILASPGVAQQNMSDTA